MTTDLLERPGTVEDQQAARLARLAERQNARRPATRTSPGGPAAASSPRPPAPSRRKPAAGSRAAALALSVAATGGLALWLAHADAASSAAPTTAPAAASAPTLSGLTGTVAPSSATASFTGAVVQTKYGPVQVAATVSGGGITDVQVLQVPSGGKNSAINDQAVPILRSEALASQSAQIDTVSGATYTSNAYKQSLQAALDAARSAGALAG